VMTIAAAHPRRHLLRAGSPWFALSRRCYG
jgi:hypothetical protein